jgi:hypothetical protein
MAPRDRASLIHLVGLQLWMAGYRTSAFNLIDVEKFDQLSDEHKLVVLEFIFPEPAQVPKATVHNRKRAKPTCHRRPMYLRVA